MRLARHEAHHIKKYIYPVTCRGSLQGFEMLRIPHCTSNRLIDGGKVLSFTHHPRSIPGNIISLLLVLISVRN
jgi:hypothetical protein